MKRTVKLLGALGLSAMLLAGCGSSDAKPDVTAIALSEKNDESKEYTLKNATGASIVSFEVKGKDATAFSTSLLSKEDAWKEGEEALLYLPETETAPEVRIETEDGTSYTFKTFPVADFKEDVELLKEGDIFYLSWKDGDKAVTTLEDEKKDETKDEKKDEDKKEDKKQEEAPAEPSESDDVPAAPVEQPVEEPVYQEPVYEEPVYQEPVYEEPVVQQPAEVQPEVPSQGSENCVNPGDLLINPDA